jgi:hypothetical protein
MASSINPNNIDNAYPVAGQDNDSQGFRDNFTNIKTNFQYAGNEITDLQNKVLLKAALQGTTLNNDMGDNLLIAAKIQDFSATYVDLGTLSGTATVNYASGHYQVLATSGSVTLAFTNFPAAGNMGLVRVRVTVSSTGHTLTLPAAVTIGTQYLLGYNASTRTITFNQTGVFEFEFVTIDGGSSISIFDLNRNNDPQFFLSKDELASAAAASLSTTTTYFSTSAGETGTLGAGVEGQVKQFIAVDVTAGAMQITVTNPGWTGGGTITFSANGQACTLLYLNSKWYCTGNNGAVFA